MPLPEIQTCEACGVVICITRKGRGQRLVCHKLSHQTALVTSSISNCFQPDACKQEPVGHAISKTFTFSPKRRQIVDTT